MFNIFFSFLRISIDYHYKKNKRMNKKKISRDLKLRLYESLIIKKKENYFVWHFRFVFKGNEVLRCLSLSVIVWKLMITFCQNCAIWMFVASKPLTLPQPQWIPKIALNIAYNYWSSRIEKPLVSPLIDWLLLALCWTETLYQREIKYVEPSMIW